MQSFLFASAYVPETPMRKELMRIKNRLVFGTRNSWNKRHF